jgi:hypothetical protein
MTAAELGFVHRFVAPSAAGPGVTLLFFTGPEEMRTTSFR